MTSYRPANEIEMNGKGRITFVHVDERPVTVRLVTRSRSNVQPTSSVLDAILTNDLINNNE